MQVMLRALDLVQGVVHGHAGVHDPVDDPLTARDEGEREPVAVLAQAQLDLLVPALGVAVAVLGDGGRGHGAPTNRWSQRIGKALPHCGTAPRRCDVVTAEGDAPSRRARCRVTAAIGQTAPRGVPGSIPPAVVADQRFRDGGTEIVWIQS